MDLECLEKKDAVLEDLHAAWKAADKKCTVAFWSNAGLIGPAKDIWRACSLRDPQIIESIEERVSRQLKCSQEEAHQFIEALSIPVDPLPRRREITDIAIRRMEDFLTHLGRSPAYAASCYELLTSLVREAGTDVPNSRRSTAKSIAATIGRLTDLRRQSDYLRNFLSAANIKQAILRECDRLHAYTTPQTGRTWEPDPLFSGRKEELAKLRELLNPDHFHPAPPVVIHGMSGCGKTSLALHFAATQTDFRPIFIEASKRAQVIKELKHLGILELDSPAGGSGTLPHGPVTIKLPETSRILLIFDGVTDSHTLRGLVPRKSLCRVLITSTVPNLDDGFEHFGIGDWRREESISYISRTLTRQQESEMDLLAGVLSDQPLAIAQAVNYCRLMNLSINEYVDRLKRSPLLVLDRGEASGYRKTLVQAIQLNINAATQLDPLASSLLTLLSYFGSDVLPEMIFEHEALWAFAEERNLVKSGRDRKTVQVENEKES
ncbi:ATP-binding protein [Nonomuraea salmonea]|uniref:ATP-binding protein n=1 Tax=Nonomuraea salmonea TaxID=46181 RepID=UPI002FE9292D